MAGPRSGTSFGTLVDVTRTVGGCQRTLIGPARPVGYNGSVRPSHGSPTSAYEAIGVSSLAPPPISSQTPCAAGGHDPVGTCIRPPDEPRCVRQNENATEVKYRSTSWGDSTGTLSAARCPDSTTTGWEWRRS